MPASIQSNHTDFHRELKIISIRRQREVDIPRSTLTVGGGERHKAITYSSGRAYVRCCNLCGGGEDLTPEQVQTVSN